MDGLPHNYEPEGRVFESLRAHHSTSDRINSIPKPFPDIISASEQGHADAGYGVVEDYVQAHMWINLATCS